jgi:hypothetical protein
MSQQVGRPRNGLSPEDALARWSDPHPYAEIKYVDPRTMTSEQRRRRDALEEAFIERLKTGLVVASGIQEGSNRREAIHPSLWAILEIDYELDDIVGRNHLFEAAEFFEASLVPLNITDIPDWLSDRESRSPEFEHDPNYRHVKLGEIRFSLGELQAGVVRQLHEAALKGNPWQRGQDLLENAGSELLRISDLFKSQRQWRSLIESDRRGSYRLRLKQG